MAVLFSGGKDSSCALFWALSNNLKVEALVSMLPMREDSYMFHVPNIALTEIQAEAIGLPHVSSITSGAREREVSDLKEVLRELNVDAVVSGAVASEYQKRRIDRVCKELGLRSITPLWHGNEVLLLVKLVNFGFDVRFTGVYALGFNAKWLGRKLDYDSIVDLIEIRRRYGISIAGEGGEYETIVLDAPFFRKKINIVDAEALWDGIRGQLLIKKVELVGKEDEKNG